MSHPTSDDSHPSKRSKLSEDEDTVPSYGSQAYWENRYKIQFDSLARGEKDSIETLPYHAWYFNYKDLRPLILPLILGGRQEAADIIERHVDDDDDDDNSDDQDEFENNQSTVDKKEEIIESDEDQVHSESEDPLAKSGEYEEYEAKEDDNLSIDGGEDDDDDESNIARTGLASNGPIFVMEIGCGDVPLAAGLASDLNELEAITGTPSTNVVKRILCTDYSINVIDAMKKQYDRRSTNNSQDDMHKVVKDYSTLEFEVADACNLPYSHGTFDMILEKGTLDAMLSDKKQGVSNSIACVSECARVLKVDGCILLTSHLNAHTPKGLGWLEDVVYTGLHKTGGSYEIEVHGKEEIVDDDTTKMPIGTAGPAVYIIHKKAPKSENETKNVKPTIPVKFFAY